MAVSEFSASGQRFEDTAWSVVLAAGGTSPQAQAALSQLCRIYWPPIYAYQRRRGDNRHDAQDFTQCFFQHILEK